jgi:hypothetical protein
VFGNKHKSIDARAKQSTDLGSEDKLRGAFDDISNDKGYTNFKELEHYYLDEEQSTFLSSKKWIFVDSATKTKRRNIT